jgi:hypothetical protein
MKFDILLLLITLSGVSGGLIIVDLSGVPSTVNANGVFSFVLYPTSRILNTDTIKINFPVQITLTDGNRSCQAVIFA